LRPRSSAPRRGFKLALAGVFVTTIALPAFTHPAYEHAVADIDRPPQSSTRPGPQPAAVERQQRLSADPKLAPPRPKWKRRLDRLLRHKNIGVAASLGGKRLYYHRARKLRRPASNQKLLLSMGLLERFGPRARIETRARARGLAGSVVKGNLWITGRGDPTVSGDPRHARSLLVGATHLGRLARAVAASGLDTIEGRVMAGSGYFKHDWNAPGWRSYYRTYYVGLPTALTLNGNVFRGHYIRNPEKRLALALTQRLERAGVRVEGKPGAGPAPAGLTRIAEVESAPLSELITHMNVTSSNFFAEVLGKALGAAVRGPQGSIVKGARVLNTYARRLDVRVTSHDSSGLSHANRISARGIVRLLQHAGKEPWAAALRYSLASPGRGTLENRLHGVRLRAKTGTLIDVSALSGWIWLRRRGAWAEFSILSSGLPKFRAVAIEDEIVRQLAGRAG
jgi:D-alanyl-D-alanine carboxypeptidase/D-alanyl-D-alanine-endopeptidase (penicillin-binding protein 4)